MRPEELRATMEARGIGPMELARMLEPGGPSQPHISNFVAGRSRLSPVALARVEAALRRLELQAAAEQSTRQFGALVLDHVADQVVMAANGGAR